VKRLYLSGNALPAQLFTAPSSSVSYTSPSYNLVYLELAACRLTSLPASFAASVPNLRVLNLNYNFLTGEEVARAVSGLARLKKLTAVGGRVKAWKSVIAKCMRILGELEAVDFRMNPFSLGWYFPLLVNASDLSSAVQPPPPSTTRQDQEPAASTSPSKRKAPSTPTWAELDDRFRRDLPDGVYVERLAYRGLVMRACDEAAREHGGHKASRLKMLDGVEVTDGEREKAAKLLNGLEKTRATSSASGKKIREP